MNDAEIRAKFDRIKGHCEKIREEMFSLLELGVLKIDDFSELNNFTAQMANKRKPYEKRYEPMSYEELLRVWGMDKEEELP